MVRGSSPRRPALAALAVLALFLAAPQARAGFIVDTLAAAGPGNFAIFGLGGTNVNVGSTDTVFTGPGQTIGNVGVASVGAFNSSSSTPPGIQGNLYLGNNATFTQSGGNQVSGTIFTNQDAFLGTGSSTNFWSTNPPVFTATGAVADALNAAVTFKNLAANQTISGNITGTQTLTAGALGPNNTWVVNVTGDINLGNGEFLTLSGPAGTQFILNVAGNITIGGGNGEGIVLAGGLTETDVVINVTSTSTGKNVNTNGGGNAAEIHGILLDVAGGVNMSPGLVVGEIISGGDEIRLVSGAEVHGVTPPVITTVPAPAGLLLGLAGAGSFGGFAGLGWLRRRLGRQ
jgi:hypothetical protein